MYQCIRYIGVHVATITFAKLIMIHKLRFTLQGKEYKLWKQSVSISTVGVSTAYLSFTEGNNGNALVLPGTQQYTDAIIEFKHLNIISPL